MEMVIHDMRNPTVAIKSGLIETFKIFKEIESLNEE